MAGSSKRRARRPGRSDAGTGDDRTPGRSQPTIADDAPTLQPLADDSAAETVLAAADPDTDGVGEREDAVAFVPMVETAATAQAQVSAEAPEMADAMRSENAKAFEDARDRLHMIDRPGSAVGEPIIDQLTAGTEALLQRVGGDLGWGPGAMVAFNATAIQAWRANAEAMLAHWQRLAGATSWSEIIALNGAHAQSQIETMMAQTHALAAIAGRMGRQEPKGSDGRKS